MIIGRLPAAEQVAIWLLIAVPTIIYFILHPGILPYLGVLLSGNFLGRALWLYNNQWDWPPQFYWPLENLDQAGQFPRLSNG
jgi:hypothetical protein